MSGFSVLALAAVLGPMLILFGLKFGVVGTMFDKLVNNPRNLEIRAVGSGYFDQQWFDTVRGKKEVAFVMPKPRSIAATLQLKSEASGRILSTELIPSAEGDPLLGADIPAPEGMEIVLSQALSSKLKVAKNDQITGSVLRQYQGRKERVKITLDVIAVAPASVIDRDGAFTSLELLENISDFRDGRMVASMGWDGSLPATENRNYPGFRMYARSVYDVADLGEQLAAEGIEVRTRSEDVNLVRGLDRNLSSIFWIVAVIGLVGYSLSLASNLWSNVDRKRRDLSVLRVVGLRTGEIVWFPVLQAIFTAVLGWGLAALIYVGVSELINQVLANQLEAGQSVCRLLPVHFVVAFLLTLIAAILSAAVAGYRASRIEPADGLREL